MPEPLETCVLREPALHSMLQRYRRVRSERLQRLLVRRLFATVTVNVNCVVMLACSKLTFGISGISVMSLASPFLARSSLRFVIRSLTESLSVRRFRCSVRIWLEVYTEAVSPLFPPFWQAPALALFVSLPTPLSLSLPLLSAERGIP